MNQYTMDELRKFVADQEAAPGDMPVQFVMKNGSIKDIGEARFDPRTNSLTFVETRPGRRL